MTELEKIAVEIFVLKSRVELLEELLLRAFEHIKEAQAKNN